MKRYYNLEEYRRENSEFLSQPVVKSFFDKDPENLSLLKKAVIERDLYAKKQLDSRFVEHFFLYRLIKYISTLCHHFSIDYDKKRRNQKNRYLLIINKSCDNEEENTPMLDHLSHKYENSNVEELDRASDLFDLVEDKDLHKIITKLNKKERKILHLLIVKRLKHAEIAELFGETPQNISKTKKRVLAKLKNEYRRVKKNDKEQV